MKIDGAMVFFSSDLPAPGPIEVGRVGVWRDVAVQSWRAAFDRLDRPFIELAHPEAYPSAAYLPGGARSISAAPTGLADAAGDPPIHISFRRLQTLNYVKGARNVCAWPWRYPSLSSEFREGAGIRVNAAHMLGLADQIWCPTEAAARVLRRQGLSAVSVAPAPIDVTPPSYDALRAVPAYQVDFDSYARRRPAKLDLNEAFRNAGDSALWFLTVADPDDSFNNLEANLRGFALAARTSRAQGGPALKMVIVLGLDARRRAETVAADWLSRIVNRHFQVDADLVSEDMALIADPLSPGAFAALCQQADFYLSTLTAADQNLPLQTAMAFAAVPIAVMTEEASEYLTEATAFPISSQPVIFPLTAPLGDAELEWLGGGDMRSEALTARAVADACLEAAQAPTELRRQMASVSTQLAGERFSPAAVDARITHLLAALSGLPPRRLRLRPEMPPEAAPGERPKHQNGAPQDQLLPVGASS